MKGNLNPISSKARRYSISCPMRIHKQNIRTMRLLAPLKTSWRSCQACFVPPFPQRNIRFLHQRMCCMPFHLCLIGHSLYNSYRLILVIIKCFTKNCKYFLHRDFTVHQFGQQSVAGGGQRADLFAVFYDFFNQWRNNLIRNL